MNSRAKGCRGEREFRDLLRAHGFLKAFRGQQYCGLRGNQDVVCPEMPRIHNEVKRVEQGHGKTYDWLEQARRDAAGESDVTARLAMVWHKRNNSPWLVTLYADTQIEILKETNLVQ